MRIPLPSVRREVPAASIDTEARSTGAPVSETDVLEAGARHALPFIYDFYDPLHGPIGMPHEPSVKSVELFRLLGRFWTLANMLSMIRLLLVVPIAYLILTDGPLGWLFGLILLALMTDWFDGRVARWSGTVSDWGKVLDPLADKAAGAAIVMALVVRGSLPVWFLSMLVVRDGLIVAGGVVLARRTGHVVMSAWMGKVAVTALSVTVLAALMRADAPILLYCVWITTALMGYSFLLYAVRFVRLMKTGKLPESAAPLSEGGLVHQETESSGRSR